MNKVIIVDDNKLTIEGIYQHINWNELDAEVVATFSNARKALSFVANEEIDLIISDISMPELTGIEFAKIVLKEKPHIKVIFISAYDDFSYAQEALRLEVSDYVEKPIDYDYLSNLIVKTLHQSEQEKKILKQLELSRPALIQNFFIDLISTSPEYAEFHLAKQARYMNLDLTPEEYVAVIFQIDNILETMDEVGVERYHVMIIRLTQQLKQLFAEEYSFHYCNQGDQLVVILGNKLNKQDFTKDISEKISDFHSKIVASFLSLTIGIGDEVKKLWDISQSYQNAKHALGYKFIFSEGSIFNIKDVKNTASMPIFFTNNDEELIIKLISKKDLKNLKQFTDSLVIKWAEEHSDKNGIIAYVYALGARLVRFFYDVGINDAELTSKVNELFSKLDNYQTSEQIGAHLLQICEEACLKLEKSVDTHHQQIVEQVIDFINHHYMDMDLSINDIASMVNLNPSYLGTVFKSATGESISKYLTQIRMEKAKTLLNTTNLKIGEISERVGYANQYYFSASFKKFSGNTPSEFRVNN